MFNSFELPDLLGHINGQLSAYEMAPAFGRNRVFLVAMGGQGLPDLGDDAGPAQTLHLMVLRPGESPHFDPELAIFGSLPGIPTGMFPAVRVGGDLPPGVRRVRGQIFRDEHGRLYERTGRQINRLHQLVSGAHGEILNVSSTTPSERRVRPSAQDQAVPVYEATPEEDEPSAACDYERGGEPSAGAFAEPRRVTTATPKPYRLLFPEPGQLRMLQLGNFKEMLTPQIAYPERLRDSHRMLCYVQVYEVIRRERLESLTTDVLGGFGSGQELRVLDEAAAAKLGLTPLLRNRPRLVRRFKQEPGWLLPFERLFRLQLLQDPTQESDEPGGKLSGGPTGGTEFHAQAAAARPGTAPGSPGNRNSVPEKYMKPWEFKLTREEAMYDMNVTASQRGLFRSLWRALKRGFAGRSEFRKWQVLLLGKAPDEQLWSVRPPTDWLSHHAVRTWVQNTLSAAGYDTRTMLWEWEIFWRRKGLR